MKKGCSILIIMLANCIIVLGQPFIIDKVNPVIANGHGDYLRKYFSFTVYSLQPSGDYNKRNKALGLPKDPYLMMVTLYSNNLAVNNATLYTNFPQLEKYPNDTVNTAMTMDYTYGGRYPIPIFDSTGIIVVVQGINKRNANQYEFRVLKNQNEVVVPWRIPTLFSKWVLYTYVQKLYNTEADSVGAYLGQFKATRGNRLTFEVRKKNKPELIQARQSALWLDRFPTIVNVFTTNQMPGFLETFKRQWKKPQLFEDYKDWLPEKDSLKNLPKQFKPGVSSLIFYLDDIIKSKEILEYNLVSESDSTGWRANDFDLNFIWLKNLSPGRHQLKIRFSVQRHNVTTYAFTIKPAWYQTLWLKLLSGILSLLAIMSVVLLVKNRKQKNRLAQEETQKQIVQAEIKSIKSQFNPHFVFNSLNSIQGLITKNDIESAYKYLTDFSSLLRNSLKESEHEFISLTKDIHLINNYLKLEQLRFGFQYQIKVTPEINADAIEVPVLLLQPVIENAIKHGVSSLYEKGTLFIKYAIADNGLHIVVSDNGKGYDPNHTSNGLGLKLTKDRIDLINKILNNQHIVWAITNTATGTKATFTFKNWLL